ncbi:MAG: M23 family metallopeptidase [Romboutsia sp.]
MKKKLLEKDGFYLALFICVCLVAVGGVWFTSKRVDNLASTNELNKDKEDELHLIQDDKNGAIPTATDSDENLQKAKEKTQETSNIEKSKLNFIGNKVVREYSEKEPSYSKTLEVWEIHKGLDVSADNGQEIKSLLNGKVVDVFNDGEYGMSVKISYDNDISVVYSNLNEKVLVKKDDKIKEGQSIGTVGSTSLVESEDGVHVHLEAYQGDKSIDPMTLIK